MEEIVKLFVKLCSTNETLTDEEKNHIKGLIEEYSIKKDDMHKLIYKIGSLLYYNDLKEKGKSQYEITKYIAEDKTTIHDAEEYVLQHLKLKDNMFGYPANMYNNTAAVEYLRYLESQLYLINSCGGPNDRGNYQMDNKDMELKIIELFMKNLNIDKSNHWGYITSGGTEGNFWGIRAGFDKFPNGILYFSKDAHYSVNKYANQNDVMIYQNENITSKSGKINVKKLIERCKKIGMNLLNRQLYC